MAAAIGLLELDILIPGSTSLKDKRKVIRSLKDKLRERYNVSVAEVDYQDLVGRCHLAVVTVAPDCSKAQERLDAAARLADSIPGAVVREQMVQFL